MILLKSVRRSGVGPGLFWPLWLSPLRVEGTGSHGMLLSWISWTASPRWEVTQSNWADRHQTQWIMTSPGTTWIRCRGYLPCGQSMTFLGRRYIYTCADRPLHPACGRYAALTNPAIVPISSPVPDTVDPDTWKLVVMTFRRKGQW